MDGASTEEDSSRNRPRRARAEGGRSHRSTVWMSDAELEAIAEAARQENLAVGAWLCQAGVRVARAPLGQFAEGGSSARMQALMVARAELMEARQQLRRVGVNLNAVARVANAAGSLVPQTARVLEDVKDAVQELDETVAQVDEAVREARGVVKAIRR